MQLNAWWVALVLGLTAACKSSGDSPNGGTAASSVAGAGGGARNGTPPQGGNHTAATKGGGGASGGMAATQGGAGASNGGAGASNGGAGGTIAGDSTATGPCSDVRLTAYVDAGESFACGYLKSHGFLAPFVRKQMTMAMAEPFYGSSFRGSPGEACGECWLITTPTKSGIVMVTDLCPIEGNPLCADSNQLHFDLTEEAGAVLEGGGNDMGAARPVACPLTGNIHVEITDRSWGYFQVAMINHVIPVRQAEVRAADGGDWIPMSRVWGAVWAVDDPMFVAGAPGGVLRVTSSQGEVQTSSVVITEAFQPHASLDLGIQFTNLAPVAGGVCSM